MLDFRPPAIADKERIEAFVRQSGQIGCDTGFVNTYLWRDHYNIRVAFDEDSYYKCYYIDGQLTGYSLPMTNGDIRKAIEKVLLDAKEHGVKPLIGLLNETNAELIKRLYGDRIVLSEDRDSFDYIYERENLAQLAGKKYHAKRNHLSRFKRTYIDYSVKELCKNNFADAMDVAKRWQAENDDTGELDIIRDAFDHFDELGLFGLILYVSDKPAAMCIASEINDCVCDVSFEKAVDIDEGFAVINNEFAKHYTKYKLINREEDMGLEGLRKAKLSYHPDILYTKSHAVFH
ncbi:MAG: DUF2156 domain-containing protein [Ruminococcus sp.]|nr:DUF2156 domain-containing protein [Ruminococcus sp.]